MNKSKKKKKKDCGETTNESRPKLWASIDFQATKVVIEWSENSSDLSNAVDWNTNAVNTDVDYERNVCAHVTFVFVKNSQTVYHNWQAQCVFCLISLGKF